MNKILLFLLCFVSAIRLNAQDTFSIVAVDTITGEIGSAGASCLDNIQFPGSNGAIIISDILPGRGAIHTQSYWNATNQANARLRMEEGLSPTQVIAWLKANDVQGGFSWINRQYGIIDLDAQGHPRSAALTGSSCLDWKGHKTGINYSIQGNILLGAQILDSMEARFLGATGTLADRLMACLQGANVPGADSRCLNNGTSSLSAFLRVAKPTDNEDDLWLDLNVPSLPAGMEPIDSLQRLYDAWTAVGVEIPTKVDKVVFFPNPAKGELMIEIEESNTLLELFDMNGKLLYSNTLQKGINRVNPVSLTKGVYVGRVSTGVGEGRTFRLIWE